MTEIKRAEPPQFWFNRLQFPILPLLSPETFGHYFRSLEPETGCHLYCQTVLFMPWWILFFDRNSSWMFALGIYLPLGNLMANLHPTAHKNRILQPVDFTKIEKITRRRTAPPQWKKKRYKQVQVCLKQLLKTKTTLYTTRLSNNWHSRN